MGIFFLEQDIEHFLPPAHAPDIGLFHQAANADRLLAVARGKMIESRAILVALGEMREQFFDGGHPKPLELALPRHWDPVQGFERGGGMHGES
jgi:hypothetical protein